MDEKKHKVELTDETALKHWEEILQEVESAYSDHLAHGGDIDGIEEQSIYHLRYILDLIHRLQSENKRLTEEKAGYEDLKLFNLAMMNGELDMTISGEYAKAFFNAIIGIFDQNGAKNYFTTTVDIEGRKGRYAFTIEKAGGQTVAEKLAELEDKIEQGTLIELPCKVGDKVYRKIPEGAVVLTREELNDLEYKAYARGVNSFNTLHEKQLGKARKETAEKFAEKLKAELDEFWEDYEDDDGKVDKGVFILDVLGVESLGGEVITEGLIDKICKEITEGKNET